LLDYFGAKSACQTLGTDADLAAPKTEAIQNVLNNLWTALGDEEADTWIGLDDCGSATSPCDDSADGNFTFSDGSSLAVSSGSFDNQDVEWEGYNDFKEGQPVADFGKRQKQDCIKIDKTLNWDDVNCENTMTYACEKPSTGGSTVSGGSSSTGGSTVSGGSSSTGRSSSTTTGTSSASTASTTGSSSCGDDSWTQEGDKCYKIFSEGLLDYFGAKSACQTLGTDADLAAPKTEAIQNVLNNLWTALGDEEADTWIGLDDCGSATSPCDDSADGNFTFSDGSSLAVSSGSFDNQDVEWEGYNDFKEGQPVADFGKRQKQDCIKIDKTLNWDDVNCENTMTYACEKPTA